MASPNTTEIDKVRYDERGFPDGGVVVDKNWDGYMQYEPTNNQFRIGKGVVELADQGEDLVVDAMALHEDEHRRYMELSLEQQQLLNQGFLFEMQQNPSFWQNFHQFAVALYELDKTPPGNDYLTQHMEINSPHLSRDNVKGVKVDDKGKSMIEIPFGDKKYPVHMGFLLTEFLSYAAISQSQLMKNAYLAKAIKSKGMVEKSEAAMSAARPDFKALLIRNGGFGLTKKIPYWKQYLK